MPTTFLLTYSAKEVITQTEHVALCDYIELRLKGVRLHDYAYLISSDNSPAELYKELLLFMDRNDRIIIAALQQPCFYDNLSSSAQHFIELHLPASGITESKG